jgi:hypothetical protein
VARAAQLHDGGADCKAAPRTGVRPIILQGSVSENALLPAAALHRFARSRIVPRTWSRAVQTYTLAIADGVLFACLPDEADIGAAIADAAAVSYGFGLCLDVVRGTTLTDAAGPDDEVVLQESPDSELLDADGRSYRYAVRRLS